MNCDEPPTRKRVPGSHVGTATQAAYEKTCQGSGPTPKEERQMRRARKKKKKIPPPNYWKKKKGRR